MPQGPKACAFLQAKAAPLVHTWLGRTRTDFGPQVQASQSGHRTPVIKLICNSISQKLGHDLLFMVKDLHDVASAYHQPPVFSNHTHSVHTGSLVFSSFAPLAPCELWIGSLFCPGRCTVWPDIYFFIKYHILMSYTFFDILSSPRQNHLCYFPCTSFLSLLEHPSHCSVIISISLSPSSL